MVVLESILNFLQLIADYFSMAFNGVITLFQFIPGVLNSLIGTFAYLPDFIAPFMLISMSVTMVFAIIRLIF